MVCKKCNTVIADNLEFCPSCGCPTGKTNKPADTGKKLGILGIVFSVDLTIVGLILSIIGLVKGIKSRDKVSIILNSIGLGLSILFSIIYTMYFINSIEETIDRINDFIELSEINGE